MVSTFFLLPQADSLPFNFRKHQSWISLLIPTNLDVLEEDFDFLKKLLSWNKKCTINRAALP